MKLSRAWPIVCLSFLAMFLPLAPRRGDLVLSACALGEFLLRLGLRAMHLGFELLPILLPHPLRLLQIRHAALSLVDFSRHRGTLLLDRSAQFLNFLAAFAHLLIGHAAAIGELLPFLLQGVAGAAVVGPRAHRLRAALETAADGPLTVG